MTLIDKACWERGCACYDTRFDGNGIKVIAKHGWVGLTRTELVRCGVLPFGTSYKLYEAIEAKLRSKNMREDDDDIQDYISPKERMFADTFHQVVRNQTLEEVAREFDKMKSLGDTAASFAAYVRNMKK